MSDALIDRIADDLASEEYSVADNFVTAPLLDELLEVFSHHHEQDHFRKAGIGNFHNFQVNKKVRGDEIKWIDKEQALAPTLRFLEYIEELQSELNRLLYLSLKDCECHFAVYPPGAFYERHLDQFQHTKNRKLSFAFYLNKNWQPGQGGELRLYGKDTYRDISPAANRLVLFRSDSVEHEVLKTNVYRYSITGWMSDRPLDLPFS